MAIVEGTQFGRVGAFRFWCQKVLPAVYDDSLSYYELLCKVIAYLNEVITVTNTQSDAIAELQELVNQFIESNVYEIVENAIDEWFTLNGDNLLNRIDEAEQKVDEFSALVRNKVFAQPNFTAVSRFEAGTWEDPANSSMQSGCVFEQNGTLYWAQIIQATDTTQDQLVIMDIGNNSNVSTSIMQLGHGNTISYNAERLQLMTSDDIAGELVFIDVSNVGSPSIADRVDYTVLPGYTQLQFAWIENHIGALNIYSNILRTYDDTLTLVESYTLETEDGKVHNNGYVFQNFMYDNVTNCIYIGASTPDCIIVIDFEDCVQKNCIQCRTNYGFIYMMELESAYVHNGCIYINNYEDVDNFLVCTLLKFDMVHGTIDSEDSFYERPSSNRVQAYVDYSTGRILPQVINGDYGTFKYFGDLIKQFKYNGFDGEIRGIVREDYPGIINCMGENIVISVAGSMNIGGINARQSKLTLNNAGNMNIGFNQQVTLGANTFNVAIDALYGEVIIESDAVPTIPSQNTRDVLILCANGTIRMMNNATADANRRIASTQTVIYVKDAANIINDFQYRNCVIVNTV